MSAQKVLLAVSGGVDSAIAGYLLKSKGFQVIGAFMRNWNDFEGNDSCTNNQDLTDAQYVCDKLRIPLIELNFVKHYWNKVFRSFLADYENGLTPNPDILCNKFIKFDAFYRHAVQCLNINIIATGHYARTSFGSYLENYKDNQDVRLYQAFDKSKDQTFFLSHVNQESLRKTMFPLGNYLKSDVKKIAQTIGLSRISYKRESMGICFIGNREFQPFITEYIAPKTGNFIDVDTGLIVGMHNGIHCWTVGQRCKIPGCLRPYFVARKDAKLNEIYVASGENHPLLHTKDVLTFQPSWIRKVPNQEAFVDCRFRFQHTKPLVKCRIHQLKEGLYVQLDETVRAVTPGQYAVFYLNEECLGSARIIK